MTDIDIDKIKKLLAEATSPRDIKMYEGILSKLGVVTLTPIPPTRPSVSPEPKVSVKPKPIKPIDEVPITPIEPNATLEPQVNPIFQAIGILKGSVTFREEGKAVISVGGIEYSLLYLSNKRKRKVYEALKHEVEVSGNAEQRVIVYPKVTHFPSRDEPYVLAFYLVGFITPVSSDSNKPGIESQLNDFEFILRGLWQFIPVCRTPCVSIHRNFTGARLEWIKGVEAYKQVKFMKSSHIPLLWKNSSIRPFRYNPKVEEQEGRPYFIAVKAKFLPERNVFAFMEELGQALEEPPRFLKASKELKAEVMKAKNALSQDG